MIYYQVLYDMLGYVSNTSLSLLTCSSPTSCRPLHSHIGCTATAFHSHLRSSRHVTDLLLERMSPQLHNYDRTIHSFMHPTQSGGGAQMIYSEIRLNQATFTSCTCINVSMSCILFVVLTLSKRPPTTNTVRRSHTYYTA